jgi:flagellar protein FlbT
MSRLVLKLGPKERVLINGAVIENSDRRSKFTILSSKANILRLKDAIHPDNADTPIKRACYLAQLLLSGEVEAEPTWNRLNGQVHVLAEIFVDEDSSSILSKAKVAITHRNAYACLKLLRQILPLETQLLALREQ